MSSARKPSSSAIAALKDRIRKQKQEAERREADAAEKIRQEKEEKERLEREAAAAEAHRKQLAELRKQKRDALRAQGVLRTASQRDRDEGNRRFLQQLTQQSDGLRIMMCQTQTHDTAPQDRPSGEEINVTSTLRNPVGAILGHVDCGKTSFLDYVRGGSSVRAKEAGGITQQMSITELARTRLAYLCESSKPSDINFASMWLIDTPGHASFRNFRQRGSDLGDFAIVIVNLMHGIEQTTLECMENIVECGIPFAIVANKVDKLYAWNVSESDLFKQPSNTQDEYERRINEIFRTIAIKFPDLDLQKLQLRTYPVSAKTGQGIAHCLKGIVDLLQTDVACTLDIGTPTDEFHGFVLEVQEVDGLGTTVDALVVRGTIATGDQIVLSSTTGPVVTVVRAMYRNASLQQSLKRVTGETVHVQIVASNLQHTLPGTSFYRIDANSGNDVDEQLNMYTKKVEENVDATLRLRSDDSMGILLFAPTLGAIEAIVHQAHHVESPRIPILLSSIGSVHRKDIARAAIMLEDPMTREFGVIAAFGVTVSKEDREYAAQLGVKLITCDVIYQLFEQLHKHLHAVHQERRVQASAVAVFPCVLHVVPQCVFNAKAPIVLGVQVMEGIVQVGTPLCVPCRGSLRIGRVTSIQRNKIDCNRARKGEQISIKLEVGAGEQSLTVGRQFQESDEIVSHLSRASIDALKQFYKDDLTAEDWKLVVKLKRQLAIP